MPRTVLGPETLGGNADDRRVTRQVWDIEWACGSGQEVAVGMPDEVKESFLEEGVYKQSPRG